MTANRARNVDPEGMGTATIKPVKGTGKKKTSARTASGAADNSLAAARDEWLGSPDGIGELENETGGCESSTAEAILEARPEKKLSAFYHGFDELREKLCASTSRYYHTCFEIARSNKTELNVDNPADLAKSITARDISAFLRVTGLDGKEAREIGSNGRVREFVRNVCLNYPDFQILEADRREATPLPRWPQGRSFGATIARGPKTRADGDESSTLTLEETDRFILGAEETLIKSLRHAIEHVHRIALVDLGKNGIVAGTAADSANRPTVPSYERSPLKSTVAWLLFQNQSHFVSDRKLCDLLDENGSVELLPSWSKNRNREYVEAYKDKSVRPRMARLFSGVRADLRKAGLHIP